MFARARLLRVGRQLATASVAVSTAAAAAATLPSGGSQCEPARSLSQIRAKDFKLLDHYHGKARVRVLRVHHDGPRHSVREYSVQTRLFSPDYDKVFTEMKNDGLVATDTQKNTVYVVAKRSESRTLEGFGVDVARHMMREYPMLSAVEVEIQEDLWDRAITPDGEPHEHGFVKRGPERSTARVRLTREEPDAPEVVSGFTGLTVLKTTKSGFSNFLRDKYTLLPETEERCLATEMQVEWRYTCGRSAKQPPPAPDYAAVRAGVRDELLKAFYGPAEGGVFSVSLQATIYDAGCLVLAAMPRVASISIFTPNIHMIPFTPLAQLGGQKAQPFEDDVFVATSDPAGTIHCTVSR